MNRMSFVLELTGGGDLHREREMRLKALICMLCLGVRFSDASTGFFSHKLQLDQLVYIRAFDVTIGTMYLTDVAGVEVLKG
jgi:TPP-dependent 2-oxoacid decarboxylase